MLTFHPLTLSDLTWVEQCAAAEGSRSADFHFGEMFLWSHDYPLMAAASGGFAILLCRAMTPPAFLVPFGSGDIAPCIGEMRNYAAAQGFPFTLYGLEERHVHLFEQLFPGQYTLTEDRAYADYIYTADKLITLAGKHLHGKRNHCTRFMAEHDWSFRVLRREDFPHCMALFEQWAAREPAAAQEAVISERIALQRAMEHCEALSLFGGVLFADGALIGFTLGRKTMSDTFEVHFEKARADINGAFTMVNREFVKLVRETHPEIVYVNREDDMGLANLRKSKESYCPDILLRKFSVHWKEA